MSDDMRLDGNAIGGLLHEIFGREMTTSAGCCRACGTVSALGSVHVYRRAPGDVVRCPACETVLMVVVAAPDGLRVSFEALRWISVPAADRS